MLEFWLRIECYICEVCVVVWTEVFYVELLGDRDPPVKQLNGIEGHVLFIFRHT